MWRSVCSRESRWIDLTCKFDSHFLRKTVVCLFLEIILAHVWGAAYKKARFSEVCQPHWLKTIEVYFHLSNDCIVAFYSFRVMTILLRSPISCGKRMFYGTKFKKTRSNGSEKKGWVLPIRHPHHISSSGNGKRWCKVRGQRTNAALLKCSALTRKVRTKALKSSIYIVHIIALQ